MQVQMFPDPSYGTQLDFPLWNGGVHIFLNANTCFDVIYMLTWQIQSITL